MSDLVAGGAGLFGGDGKQGVVKEAFAQGDALVGERGVGGQLWNGKAPGQPETIGRADQVSGSGGIRRGRRTRLPDFTDREGGRNPVLQQLRDLVALARVSGRIGSDLEGFGAVEKTIEVDIDGNGDRTGDFEQEGQRDRSPVPGIAQVIGEAAGIPVAKIIGDIVGLVQEKV